jgi:hypothetical protein
MVLSSTAIITSIIPLSLLLPRPLLSMRVKPVRVKPVPSERLKPHPGHTSAKEHVKNLSRIDIVLKPTKRRVRLPRVPPPHPSRHTLRPFLAPVPIVRRPFLRVRQTRERFTHNLKRLLRSCPLTLIRVNLHR